MMCLTDGVTQAGLTLDAGVSVSVSGVYLARTGYIGQGESKTEDQMKAEDDDGYSNWDFETIWTTDKADRDDDEKINEGYPYFRVHDYILIAKGTIAGRVLGGGLELMEDSLEFSYIRNHSLEIEVRYSGSTGIYSIIADANYRNSQITLMRYVRFVGGEIEHLGTV